MDIWSKQKRSLVMAKIKGKNTKPERLLRSALFRLGLRYRIHVKKLPGTPDIVLAKYKTAIFVHGCFWHYHKDCREGRVPSSNSKFWKEKLERNIKKDKINIDALELAGWNVIVVWECEIEKQLEMTLNKIVSNLK
ncbi:DNA mismatch endonuclease Vsr [Niastella caeni]|uniref:Very short patch repair endonuclease n=2 Tax=Niastella caeni TaxID=2569763 RepID=A0A4S8I460_9BACT|nr:DNA mismatch endonuclease Vsr [Niastella caeni]